MPAFRKFIHTVVWGEQQDFQKLLRIPLRHLLLIPALCMAIRMVAKVLIYDQRYLMLLYPMYWVQLFLMAGFLYLAGGRTAGFLTILKILSLASVFLFFSWITFFGWLLTICQLCFIVIRLKQFGGFSYHSAAVSVLIGYFFTGFVALFGFFGWQAILPYPIFEPLGLVH